MGFGEGFEDFWVGVVEFDSAEFERLDEFDGMGRGREVVAELAIVDSELA